MRILHVTESFHPIIGGSETAIRYLGDTMADLGHEVMVAVMNVRDAFSPSTKFSFSRISSHVGFLDLKTLGKIHHCVRLIRSFRPDVVNAHFLFESGFVGTAAAHRCHVPSVVSIRGRGIFFRPSNLVETVLSRWWIHGARGADGFIATSQEMAEIARARWGIQPVTISNGVDTTAFHPSRVKDIRTPLHVRAEQRVIFCARRLVPKNGIEYMVRALPLIRRNADVVLLLAAKREAEYERLRAIAAELGVGDVIHFLGPLDHSNLPFYYASADVVVQPSVAEARSLACLEAMASGAVIVATATGGLAEILRDGESAVLVPPFEPSTYSVGPVTQEGVERLAAAVLRVLDDEQLRERVRRGARGEAEQYSWRRVAEQTLAKYQQTIEGFLHH